MNINGQSARMITALSALASAPGLFGADSIRQPTNNNGSLVEFGEPYIALRPPISSSFNRGMYFTGWVDAPSGEFLKYVTASELTNPQIVHSERLHEKGGLMITGDSTIPIAADQLIVRGQSNESQQLILGYHTAQGYGSIQAVQQNSSVKPLALNPFGGNVGIGTASPQAKLDIRGTVRSEMVQITGADLAEKFPASEKLEPGMVVSIDAVNRRKLCLGRQAYDKRVAGVVSGANGFHAGAVLGNLPGSEDSPAIALSGRVYVWCDASNGSIAPGDRLTTSSIPGHAM